MKEPTREADRRLRRLLREGDPLASAPRPEPARVAGIRRRVLAEAASQPRPGALGWLAPALVVLALGLALGPLWWERHATVTAGPDAGLPARTSREIQYTTDRGTLMVWILDPDFNLPRAD